MLRSKKLFLLVFAPDAVTISGKTSLYNSQPEHVVITSRSKLVGGETGTSTVDIINTTNYDNAPLSSTVIYDPSFAFAGTAGPYDTDDGDLI